MSIFIYSSYYKPSLAFIMVIYLVIQGIPHHLLILLLLNTLLLFFFPYYKWYYNEHFCTQNFSVFKIVFFGQTPRFKITCPRLGILRPFLFIDTLFYKEVVIFLSPTSNTLYLILNILKILIYVNMISKKLQLASILICILSFSN